MAARALTLSEEDLLSVKLGRCRLCRIQLAIPSQLRCRRKVHNLLKLRHEVYLASALQHIHALLRCNHRIAVEVGRSLLELREVLYRLQRPLRAEEPLNIHTTQRRCLDAMAELLRPNIAYQVERTVCSAIRMAIQARNSTARLLRAPIDRLIELLLRKRRQQQPQALKLLWVQNA